MGYADKSEIRGKINTRILSPITTYEFYFIFYTDSYWCYEMNETLMEVTFNGETLFVFLEMEVFYYGDLEKPPDDPEGYYSPKKRQDREGGFMELSKCIVGPPTSCNLNWVNTFVGETMNWCFSW